MSAEIGVTGATNVSPVSESYRRYAIGLLFFVYVFNFIDRQIVTILAEPIKQDLGIADWQLAEVVQGLRDGERVVVSRDRKGVVAGAKVAVDDEVLGRWKLGTGSELEHGKRS